MNLKKSIEDLQYDCRDSSSFRRVSGELENMMEMSYQETRRLARRKHKCCSCGILFMQRVKIGGSLTYIVTLLEETNKRGILECNTPGGKVETFDENRKITAIRETYEEMGVLINPDDLNNCKIATTVFPNTGFIKHLDYIKITNYQVITKDSFEQSMLVRQQICPYLSEELTTEANKSKFLVLADFSELRTKAEKGKEFEDLSGKPHTMGNRLREMLNENDWDDLIGTKDCVICGLS